MNQRNEGNSGNSGLEAAPLAGIESKVLQRYKESARRVEPSLCCPPAYDPQEIQWLPQEIVQKDYGCGDPTLTVGEGEVVVDLGSGAGKACFILSRKVGPHGRVIGVDFNDEMLALARKYLDAVGDKLGYRNVRFVKGKIQDLALNLENAEKWLKARPIRTLEHLQAFEEECERLRKEMPLIPEGSADVVVSNCVLNLVRPQDKTKLFSEIFRVLRRGGRAVISDIVCDEDPNPAIQADPDLWTGCIAGAFREDSFLEMFEDQGFYGIEILSRQAQPWRVIEGIEFRSLTVRAYKGKEGPCLERSQAVIYKGPWKSVRDDDGHTLHRGNRVAVCDKTYHLLTGPQSPYRDEVIPVPPLGEVALDKAGEFRCEGTRLRHPRETKGQDYQVTTSADKKACCGPGGCL